MDDTAEAGPTEVSGSEMGGTAGGGFCPSCGAARLGAFCHGCGQRLHERRLSVHFLLHELLQHWHLERGLLRTFRDLTVRPGAMLRGYFDGRRWPYTGPLTYLLLAAAVSLVVSHLYADRLLQWSERFAQDMARLGGGSMPPRQLQAIIEVTAWLVQHTAITLLGGCVPFALLLRWLLRRTGVNLVEATVFSFYTWAHASLLATPMMAALVLTTGSMGAATWISLLVYAVLISVAAVGCFGGSWRTAVRAILAMIGAFAAFSLASNVATALYLRHLG